MDGTLARVSGKGSRFGAFLDSTIDRFEESLVFLGLIFYYAQTGSELEVTLTLLVTVGSLMVSYTRARAEGLGISCKVGFMTRIPRVAILIAALILNQVLIALIILAVTTLWTTGHRMVHAWKMTGGEAGGWAPPKDIFISPGLLDEEDKGDEAAEIEA
jgi:CDP-diacylglycerol--glycerol-3-phosphate 3-phosphatidyltransferase